MSVLQTRRIVITGGPGSGKTALINFLEQQNYLCFPEVSRSIILEAQKQGIDQLFLEDPVMFSKLLLEGRLKQYNEGTHKSAPLVFYDRGIPDILAYLEFKKTPYPSLFKEESQKNTYDFIFVLPPWEAIYQRDNERYESFEQAQAIHLHLVATYKRYDYEVYSLPHGTLAERADFLFKKINILL